MPTRRQLKQQGTQELWPDEPDEHTSLDSSPPLSLAPELPLPLPHCSRRLRPTALAASPGPGHGPMLSSCSSVKTSSGNGASGGQLASRMGFGNKSSKLTGSWWCFQRRSKVAPRMHQYFKACSTRSAGSNACSSKQSTGMLTETLHNVTSDVLWNGQKACHAHEHPVRLTVNLIRW